MLSGLRAANSQGVWELYDLLQGMPDVADIRHGSIPKTTVCAEGIPEMRAVIDQACQNGKCYATLAKSGDDAVDDAVAQTIDGMGYKVAINPQEILISWS